MDKISKEEYIMALGVVSCYEMENNVNTHYQSKKNYAEKPEDPLKEKEEEKELEDKG